jgi:hypothetical protein
MVNIKEYNFFQSETASQFPYSSLVPIGLILITVHQLKLYHAYYLI